MLADLNCGDKSEVDQSEEKEKDQNVFHLLKWISNSFDNRKNKITMIKQSHIL